MHPADMPAQQQSDRERVAITINAQRMAEIATLRRECAFWRERCLLLEAAAELPAHQRGPEAAKPHAAAATG